MRARRERGREARPGVAPGRLVRDDDPFAMAARPAVWWTLLIGVRILPGGDCTGESAARGDPAHCQRGRYDD